MYDFLKQIFYYFFRLFNRIEFIGERNLPIGSKLIVCSNHISIVDPLFIIAALNNRKISFMAKYEAFKIPIINLFLKAMGAFPVKRGTNDLSAMKSSIAVINSADNALGIFPAGTREFKSDKITPKKGVGFLVNKTKATLLPVKIICKGRVFIFKKIKVIIGKPIEFCNFDITNLNNIPEYISEKIFKSIYALGDTI